MGSESCLTDGTIRLTSAYKFAKAIRKSGVTFMLYYAEVENKLHWLGSKSNALNN
ncbi:hypothetical protein L3i20_v219030 [Paenibacillus sp. L3-i20]|nr:hypothetical protein L3i20_v219030 [Paenibacillus sp. L3-i20]